MSKKLIITLLLLSIVVVGIFTYLIINYNSNAEDKENEQQIEDILLEVEDLSLRIDEPGKKLKYTISNPSNIEYEKTINATGDGIMLNGDYVVPQKIGTYYVTIIVKFNDKSVYEVLSVNVLSPNFNATLEVVDTNMNSVENLFFTNTYFLKVTLSKNVEFNLFSSNSAVNIQKISAQNNVVLYSFDCVEPSADLISKNDEITFTLSYYNLTFSTSKQTYYYQKDFNVTFSNGEIANKINLYKFNNAYTKEANIDGYYNNSIFKIIPINNYLNLYRCEISNTNVAKIVGSSIVAVNVGECKFNIIAQDGSNYVKTFDVVVKNVELDNFSKKDDVVLNIGEKHQINYQFSPIYSINNIEVFIGGEKTVNTELEFTRSGEYVILIRDTISNKQISYKVTAQSYSFEVTFLQSFMTDSGASFENDTLYLLSAEEIFVALDYKITPVDLLSSISCDITFSQVNGLTISLEYYKSNAVIIKVGGSGSAIVNFTAKENANVTYSFAIVVA